MPQYIYRLQPTRVEMLTNGPTEQEIRVVAEHFEYLRGLTELGTVLMAGRTLNADGSVFGIVVFASDSESAARELMQNDPAVRDGLMAAELFPFRVALWSSSGPAEP